MTAGAIASAAPPRARRRLLVLCGAHALHDGFTDLLYVLLPLWQAEFGLGYAEVGLLRGVYTGAMAGFQLPAAMLAERCGGRAVLALGTLLAGAGFALAGAGSSIALLLAALFVGGLGASTQHPIASSMVADSFSGSRSRSGIATYNFAGDLGKMALPALTALLVALMPWRSASALLAGIGLAAAAAILLLLPTAAAAGAEATSPADPVAARQEDDRRGFTLLLLIGIIDTATRMGFLTFLPFLLASKGADLPTVGIALALVFAGGAAGKLVCGWLGARLGVMPTVFLTEGLTAATLLALLPLSLIPALLLLPAIGCALNGTSSVLYGTVPELVTPQHRARAFSIFYTGVLGSGAVAPALYGLVSDAADLATMMLLIAAIALATLPLAWCLRPALRKPQPPSIARQPR